VLLKEFIAEGVSALEQLYPTAEAKNIVLMLCESRLGTKNYTHIVEPDYAIKPSQLPSLQEDLKRLSSGEPVQYVIGEADFCGYKFKVTPDVLIPRPETELLCREAVKIGSRIQRMREAYGKSARPVRVLDLCTGSGCIAWTIALEMPGCEVIGTDISQKAIQVASSQNFSIQVKEREAITPKFIVSDVLDFNQEFDQGQFDLIVSNPPYIKESEKANMRVNVLNFEPPLALFVSDDDPLVYYRAIAHWAQEFLEADGKGLVEINELLAPETTSVFKQADFENTRTILDFYDKKRFVLFSK
jgi:release factor glutamine methyltransferase